MAPYVDTSLPPSTPSAPSALTTFISTHTPSPSSHSFPHRPHLHHLALQTQHNLTHQHSWTSLQIHTHSPLTHHPLPRPLLSGLPPRRLYIHPDEQISLLKRKVKGEDVPVEREWVLPSHVNEKWSLRRFGEVFDAVGRVPLEPEGGGQGIEGDGDGLLGSDGLRASTEDEQHQWEGEGGNHTGRRFESDDTEGKKRSRSKVEVRKNKWREMHPKRLLLATVCDDSTIVYYIIHDGLVKPRQN